MQALSSLDVWDFCNPADVQRACARVQRTVVPSDHAFACRAAAACSSQARQTPVHAAAADGNCEVIALLLQHGAQIDARSKSGATPLFAACEAGHAAAAEALIERGAEVWGLTASSENCMYIAALRGHTEVCFAAS